MAVVVATATAAAAATVSLMFNKNKNNKNKLMCSVCVCCCFCCELPCFFTSSYSSSSSYYSASSNLLQGNNLLLLFFLNKKKRKKIESKNYAYLLSFSFLLRAHALSLSLSFFSVSRFRYPTFSNYAASTIERTYYILHLIQPATTKKGSKTTMKRRQANQRAIYIYRETITTTATSTYIYT